MTMTRASVILSAALALFATDAWAQGANLTGRYRCIQMCRGGLQPAPAYVTQNGWELNVLDEAGNSSRAWVDWPGHIWVPNFNEGAIFSPDGMTIQFDRGRIWQRDFDVEPPPPPAPRKRRTK
jgi:hypothetical protein